MKKLEVTFVVTTKEKLQSEKNIHLWLNEVGYVHNEHEALQRELEIKISMLKEKMEQVMIGLRACYKYNRSKDLSRK